MKVSLQFRPVVRALLGATVLALGACGGPKTPEEALNQTLADCFEVLDNHQDLWLLPEHPRPTSSKLAPLRRELRESLDSSAQLPFGYSWRNPVVDAAVAEALPYLWAMQDNGYRMEALDPPDADGDGERQRFRLWGPADRWSVVLHMEKKAGRWLLSEPYQRPHKHR
ncbi:MAG: hypothetical protein DWQ01_15155 [Planctomycetota bacterium]|nr:MAG: hypothetical protein DWQ01_15155 [Planctomycetota bacterium]